MFRAVGLAAKERDLSPEKTEEISSLCRELSLELVSSEEGVRVFLDGREVTDLLRTPEMDKWSSAVALIPGVRACLLERQRAYGREGGVVAEGRDMGSVVFPDADLKFFLTASAEIRARRRYEELLKKGINLSYEEVLTQLLERDRQDQERDTAPLVVPHGAVVIDTSDLSLEELLERMHSEVKRVIKSLLK